MLMMLKIFCCFFIPRNPSRFWDNIKIVFCIGKSCQRHVSCHSHLLFFQDVIDLWIWLLVWRQTEYWPYKHWVLDLSRFGRGAPYWFSSCSVPTFLTWFYATFLTKCGRMTASGPPHVLKKRLWVSEVEWQPLDHHMSYNSGCGLVW